MITHHPDTRLLNEYASGALPLAQSACVSLHLKYCSQCRRDYQRLQQLGASLFTDLSPSQVDDSLLDTVMSRLDEESAPLSFKNDSSLSDDGYPALVQRLMTGDYEELDWKKMGPAVKISRLRTGDIEHEFALYHIRAGGSIPKHTHRGTELTLVLEGSFSDEEGFYQQGDFIIRDAEKTHTPTASQDGDCVCVGVLDAPVQFKDWHMRMINPFLRIHAH